MFKTFYPDIWMDSTYDIDFEYYYRAGYRGVIFDIDNTLVPHDADADDKAEALFKRLKSIGVFAVVVLFAFSLFMRNISD